MAEKDISKRVIFPDGEQGKFIELILETIPVSEAAKLCGVSKRTIRDWRREKFSVNYGSLLLLSERAKIPTPSKIKLKDRYWYTVVGSSVGAIAMLKKYGRVGGDPEYRKKKWYEWWEQKGRHQKHPIIGITKPIKKPRFSKELAEFAGIMMGDGGITKYQLRVTLNGEDDKEYALFVKKFIEEIFEVPVSLTHRTGQVAVDLSISRRELVTFCNKKLGLKIGNKLKQGLDVPDWIKGNLEFQKACIRGLIDTDGCIFDEIHHIRGKNYSYKRLNFRSSSFPLRISVFSFLREFGMKPKWRNTTAVQLERKEDIDRYFKLIGTNNPKHQERFNRFVGGVR